MWMPRFASAAAIVWVRTSTRAARRSISGAVRGFGRSRAGTANVIPEQDTSAGGRGREPTATASSSASTIVMASRLSTTAPTTALSGASASMNAPTAPSRTPRPDGKITVMTATIAPTALAPPRYGIAATPGCAPTEASNAVSAAPPTSHVTQ